MERAAPSRGRQRLAFAGAAISGGAYALAQPQWGFWWLAPVCMIPLLDAMRGATVARRAALGWLTGTVATGIGTITAAQSGIGAFFDLSGAEALVASLVLAQIFGAAGFALFGALAGDPARGHPAEIALRVGCCWVTMEWLRIHLLTGVPWFLFAYSLVPVPQLAQLATVAGVLGVSGWLAALNGAAMRALRDVPRRRGAVTAAAIAGGVIAHGLFSAANVERVGTRAESVRVLLVQATRNDSTAPASRDALARLSRLSASRPAADLVVWPENALGAVLPANAGLVKRAFDTFASPSTHLLFGAFHSAESTPGGIHASAVLLGPGGETLGRTDKVHLLPFSEMLPWPISRFMTPARPLVAGARPHALRTDSAALGALLCYEVMFSDLARALVDDGASILVNLSNDAWFGNGGALDQHLAAAVYRAIETRRPLLRATSTGITAVVDARGAILARLPIAAEDRLLITVTPGGGDSPYVAGGHRLPVLIAAAGVAFAASGRLARRRAPNRGT